MDRQAWQATVHGVDSLEGMNADAAAEAPIL